MGLLSVADDLDRIGLCETSGKRGGYHVVWIESEREQRQTISKV
jgi:hypothetical protein